MALSARQGANYGSVAAETHRMGVQNRWLSRRSVAFAHANAVDFIYRSYGFWDCVVVQSGSAVLLLGRLGERAAMIWLSWEREIVWMPKKYIVAMLRVFMR